MTRSNLHITLSNGKKLKCVADSSSAPEQGFIVENLILPLLRANNPADELQFLRELCTMEEQRINATYRYVIDLKTKSIAFFEEHYNFKTDSFRKGIDISQRYVDYRNSINGQI